MGVKVFLRVEYTPDEEINSFTPDTRHNKVEHIVETVHTFKVLDDTNRSHICNTVSDTLNTVLKSI